MCSNPYVNKEVCFRLDTYLWTQWLEQMEQLIRPKDLILVLCAPKGGKPFKRLDF